MFTKFSQAILNVLTNSILFVFIATILTVAWISTSGLTVRPIENGTNILGVSDDTVNIEEDIVEEQGGLDQGIKYETLFQSNEFVSIKSFYSPDGYIARISFNQPDYYSQIDEVVRVENLSNETQNLNLKIVANADIDNISIYLNGTRIVLNKSNEQLILPFQMDQGAISTFGIDVGYHLSAEYIELEILPSTQN